LTYTSGSGKTSSTSTEFRAVKTVTVLRWCWYCRGSEDVGSWNTARRFGQFHSRQVYEVYGLLPLIGYVAFGVLRADLTNPSVLAY
jgi:hypothetical protein